MTSISCRFLFLFFFAALLPSHTPLLQEAAPMSEGQAEAYPNTSEGLQKLITEILRAIEVKDSEREKELIHSLLLPTNSTWFVEEYGAGFGTSLAAAYRRMEPELEQEILTIYQGNLERGWRLPKISVKSKHLRQDPQCACIAAATKARLEEPSTAYTCTPA